MKKYLLLTSTCCLLGVHSAYTYAESERNPYGPWYLSDQSVGWYFDAELGFESEAAYTGSDEYNSEAGFNARAFYKTENGNRYFISLGEIGAYFELQNNWLLGAVFEYEEGRDNDDDPILREFDKVENTVEAQISLVKRWGDFNLALVLQPDILDRGKGMVYFAGLSYDKMINDRFRVSPFMDISFGDSEHLNTEAGVSNAVAQRSGLQAYTPSSGYKSTTLGMNFGYDISESWQLVGNMETEFYGSEMSDSPLIRDEGDDVNYDIAIGLRYQF